MLIFISEYQFSALYIEYIGFCWFLLYMLECNHYNLFNIQHQFFIYFLIYL